MLGSKRRIDRDRSRASNLHDGRPILGMQDAGMHGLTLRGKREGGKDGSSHFNPLECNRLSQKYCRSSGGGRESVGSQLGIQGRNTTATTLHPTLLLLLLCRRRRLHFLESKGCDGERGGGRQVCRMAEGKEAAAAATKT